MWCSGLSWVVGSGGGGERCQVSGVTPWPAMAWDRRTDSPVVDTTGAAPTSSGTNPGQGKAHGCTATQHRRRSAHLPHERLVRSAQGEAPDQLLPGDLREPAQPSQLLLGNTSRVDIRPPGCERDHTLIPHPRPASFSTLSREPQPLVLHRLDRLPLQQRNLDGPGVTVLRVGVPRSPPGSRQMWSRPSVPGDDATRG